MKKLLIVFSLISYNSSLFSQNVAINSTGSQANPSAMLDVSSTNSGFLPPRMTTAKMNAISSPAKGLQVFDTTTNCLMIYSGNNWQSIYCACTSAPATPGAITGSAAFCPGASGAIYSIGVVFGANSYTWNVPTGASITAGQGTPSITLTFGSVSGNISVTATNNCGTSAANTLPVNADTIPAITGQPASPPAVCAGNGSASFTVTAKGTGLTCQWQEYVTSWNNISNGGVYSGAATSTLTITNPSLAMNGNRYQCIVSGTCTPTTTSNGLATLTVNPVPTITGVTPGSRTGDGTVTLGATASAGIINWWAVATGGSSLGTGTSFTTPTLCSTSTTTYYVDATANGCTTVARTSVTATVAKTFQIDNACTLTNSLVSYYKLEDGTDFYGSNNLSNVNTVSFVPGKVNNCASFNGSSNYLLASSPLSTATTNISMAGWVYISSTSEHGCFFHNGQVSCSCDGYCLGVGNGTYDSPGNHLIVLLSGVTWGDFGVNIGTGWHFVVLTSSGNTWTGWLDGVVCGTTFNSTPNTPSANFVIGDEYTGSSRYFPGNVDEVGFWNKVLSQQEITDLYNGGTGQTMH